MITNKNTIIEFVVSFIAKKSRVSKHEIGDDTPIYNSGIISSLSLLELMQTLENNYQIVVKPEELIEDNFKNISAIVNFVQGKLQS